MDDTKNPEALLVIAGTFPEGRRPLPTDYESLERWIETEVATLLERNPALLMSILYRIDVAESLVRDAFTRCTPSALPKNLAGLMIRRQEEKLETRRRYGGRAGHR